MTMLHRIWQRHSIPPHVIHEMSWDDKQLIFASEEVEFEAEEKAREEEEKRRRQRGG